MPLLYYISNLLQLFVLGFTGAHLYTEEKTVQRKEVSIGFWAFPEQAIKSPGFIELIVPEDIVTHSDNISCRNVSYFKTN